MRASRPGTLSSATCKPLAAAAGPSSAANACLIAPTRLSAVTSASSGSALFKPSAIQPPAVFSTSMCATHAPRSLRYTTGMPIRSMCIAVGCTTIAVPAKYTGSIERPAPCKTKSPSCAAA